MIKQLIMYVATIGLVATSANSQSPEDPWDYDEIAQARCEQEQEVVNACVTQFPRWCPAQICSDEGCECSASDILDCIIFQLTYHYEDAPTENRQCINEYLLEVFSQADKQ